MNSRTDFGIPEISGDVRTTIRNNLGLSPTEELRISFLSGPGDVFGTYEFWKQNLHDPRVPIITYSAQFFELATRIQAKAQIITSRPSATAADSLFRFDSAVRPPFKNRREYFESARRYGKRVVALVDAFDPHIVIGNTDFPSHAWQSLSKGRYFILSAHNTFWPRNQKPNSIRAKTKHLLLRHHAKAIDDAVCTSIECSKQIEDVTDDRVQGLAQCPQMTESYQISERKSAKNLLFVGRIEENKGVFLLLEAFTKLLQKYPDISLKFVGDGSAQDALAAQISQIGSDRAVQLGRLDGKNVHAAIAGSDLLLCPTMTTFNEGLAVVGFEAAAHGVPTLLSSCVPALDYLGDGCVVFEADSLASLEESLEQLLADPAWYEEKVAALMDTRAAIYDRKRSWGSQLLKVMQRINTEGHV